MYSIKVFLILAFEIIKKSSLTEEYCAGNNGFSGPVSYREFLEKKGCSFLEYCDKDSTCLTL